MTTAALKSWVYMYALVKMTRDAGLTEITGEAITEMLNEVTDLDMGGLTPPWTPNATSEGIFERVSQPYYWTGRWDADEENFVLDDEQVNVVAALGGQVG
jgi:hypothetical protein